jgi:hypothetical protein
MILIEIHGKTLRVSPANGHPMGQVSLANRKQGQPRKPLGSPSFIGRKRVGMNFTSPGVVRGLAQRGIFLVGASQLESVIEKNIYFSTKVSRVK